MGGFCLLVEFHQEWSAPSACVAGLFSKHWPSGPMLSISQFIHMFVCLCVYVCVFNFEVPFKRLFAPTYQSRKSKIFRASEVMEGCGLAAQKKFVFGRIPQRSGGYTARTRRLYNKDQEVIQQGSGGYVFRRDYRASPENFCY